MRQHELMPDLEPEERAIDRLLAAVTAEPPPLGFRDAVMRRVAGERRTGWEWIVALAFALPSVAFLAWEIAVHGADFAEGLGAVFTTAAGDSSEAFFFVDGLTVLAVALLGLASVVAAHALLGGSRRATASG